MTYVKDLEEEIHRILQSSSKLHKYNSELRDKYIKQEENFDQKRKGWDRDRKKWSKKLGGIVTENQNLQFENARKAISLANFKSENDIKSKKIRSLESMIEILEGKLTSAQGDVISIQNDSSKKESENLSLKSKIAELDHIKSSLESKVNELEHLKSEAISKPIVGGDDGKNITKSDNISLGSTDLSKYFICGKNMDPIEKIDGEITELSKNDTEIIPKVIDEIDISETNNNILQEIPNMTTYLAQPENNVSSLIESNTQMGPGPEALPLSAVASTLMSPLSAYIFLILLIIAVMWFMVLRRTWDIGKKVMIEAVIYIDSQRAHDLDREIILQKLYYRPDGYYRTVEKMHNACKKAGYNFSLNDIKECLEKQILYLIHKPRPRFIQYASFNGIQNLNEMHQSNLTPMPHDKIGNRVFKYRLVIKDVATRNRKSYALTNKSASTVAKAIKKIYEDPNNPLSWPNVFRTDKGTESRTWVKGLRINDDIYNDTPTRLIHMSPNEAVKRALKGEKIIADPSVKHRRPIGFNEPRLSYKDSVLYLLEPGELEFGKRRITDMNWSTKVYRIKESLIQKNQPVLYWLMDENGDGPERSFVREQLLLVNNNIEYPPKWILKQ
ncbi:17595_t:CDS:2 [Entrophospora sp. SA101]|nr:17595_t:CDS:2 [Entrophospora sp. SA101]